MITVAHLLDDFAMGGVTRALTLFEHHRLAERGCSKIVPIKPDQRFAPSLKADLIVDHMALSWRRLLFLTSLRARNPYAHIVHVEHSYTRSFEANHVATQWRFRRMLKVATGLVDQFICVSDAQRNWLIEEVKLPQHKLRCIHPWSGRFELNAVPAARARNGRPLRLLAYGRFADIKNFDRLVLAMGQLATDEAELTLFGSGPDRALIRKLAAPLTHVTIHGPSDDIFSHLAHCDAVIVPSRNEAFGLVATEARLAGRAIIVADIDGLPEQVGSAGMSAVMTTERDIASAIRTAIKAPMAQMGANGRREVADQHEQIVNAWLEVFAMAGA